MSIERVKELFKDGCPPEPELVKAALLYLPAAIALSEAVEKIKQTWGTPAIDEAIRKAIKANEQFKKELEKE